VRYSRAKELIALSRRQSLPHGCPSYLKYHLFEGCAAAQRGSRGCCNRLPHAPLHNRMAWPLTADQAANGQVRAVFRGPSQRRRSLTMPRFRSFTRSVRAPFVFGCLRGWGTGVRPDREFRVVRVMGLPRDETCRAAPGGPAPLDSSGFPLGRVPTRSAWIPLVEESEMGTTWSWSGSGAFVEAVSEWLEGAEVFVLCV
jgi:hypothetical protein